MQTRCLGLVVLLLVALMGCHSRGGPAPGAAPHRARAAIPLEAYRLNNVGVAIMDMEKTRADAVDYFQRAVRQAPRFVEAQINLGMALYFSQRATEAVAVLEKAVQAAPDSPHAHYMLAHTYRALGRTEEAVEHFRRVVEIDPLDGYGWYYYGVVLSRSNRFQEAAQALEKAVEITPVNVSALYNLAQALIRTGQRDRARQVMDRFSQLKEAEGINIEEAGLSYLEQGPYAEAIPVALPAEQVGPRRLQTRWEEAPLQAEQVEGSAPGPPSAVVQRALAGEPVSASELLKARADLVAHWGQAAAWGDYDQDGDADLYLCQVGPNRLLRNDQGRWVDVTQQAGAAGNDRSTAAVWGDFDNDRDLDLYLLNDGPNRLYRNDGGSFTDITQRAGVAGSPDAWSVGGAWADADHDGDLDLFVCNYIDWGARPQAATIRFPQDWPGGQSVLFRNQAIHPKPGQTPMGEGGKASPAEPELRFTPPYFGDVTRQARLASGARHTRAVVFSDFDVDRDTDFYVVNEGEPNALFTNERDGTFLDIAVQAGVASLPFDPPNDLTRTVAAEDVDHDGFLDLMLVGPGGWAVLRNARHDRFEMVAGGPEPDLEWGTLVDGDNDSWFEALLVRQDSARLAAVGGEVKGQQVVEEWKLPLVANAVGLAQADYDGDGRLDLVWTRRAAGPLLWRNTTETPYRWIAAHLVGRIESDKVLSNRDGLGARIEVLGKTLWYVREVRSGTGVLGCDSNTVSLGLADVDRLHFLRVLWPSGVRLAMTDVDGDQRFNLDEPPGKVTSCPLLYAWNGERFVFVNDTLGGGVIGEKWAPGRHIPTDPDEYLPVSPQQLVPRDGVYPLRLVNQLEEVDFVDQVRLLAVDHPSSVEVWPHETLLSAPPWPQFRLFAVHAARPPARLWDDAGRDLRPLLAQIDRRYWDDFPRLLLMGLAEPHRLYLDLGPWPQEADLVLLLHGWIDYATSSSLLAAHQGGVAPDLQRLEARQPDGSWRTVMEDIGVPGGLPRTVVVPLGGRLRADERILRLTGNLEVFWDQVRVGQVVQADLQVLEVPLRRAHLRRLGFPQRIYPDNRPPETYDYGQISQRAEWGIHAGAYTRFGDVLPLLQAGDDRHVIIAPGDEMALEFEALPEPAAGHQRQYLFYIYGYGKSMDVNADASLTVEPLPYQTMPDYPYRGLPPEKEALFRRDLEEYHTRIVPMPAGWK